MVEVLGCASTASNVSFESEPKTMAEAIGEAEAATPEAVPGAESEPEPETAEEALARVLKSLRDNHANTLPMVEILREASKGERPYRDLENAVHDLFVMDMSHNNEHVLSQMLVKCGALKMIPVEEPVSAGQNPKPQALDASANETAGVAGEVAADAEAPTDGEALQDGAEPLPDMPIDYLLAITPAGLAAVAEYEPAKTLSEMLAGEPEGYAEVYAGILALCDGGAKLADIESSFSGHPAMTNPRQVYCGHFVSNLETAGGIAWENGCWNTTRGGRAFAAALANS